MRRIKRLLPYVGAAALMEEFHGERDAVLLDSSLENNLGRYTILGRHPYLSLVKDEQLTVNGEVRKESVEAYLGRYLRVHREENTTGLPIISGAIGYFSYDYGREREQIPSKEKKTLDIPEVVLNFYDEFVVEDLARKEVWLIANGKCRPAQESIAELEAAAGRVRARRAARAKEEQCGAGQAMEQTGVPNGRVGAPGAAGERISGHSAEAYVYGRVEVSSAFTKTEYMDAVNRMIRHIIEGDIYVVNMTHQLTLRAEREPYDMFCRLRTANPSPFGAFMQYGDFQVVCASPERFLQMRGRHIETRPIKGTRRRGETPQEDENLRKELASSKKDQSELLMIVDLERNDLNRVCVPGSVQVPELFTVETYATVFHLVATVTGELREGLTAADLIEAAFPGGSITGAPKRRAMELIDGQERERRNLYTGSIGYLALDGSCDFNIVIRTAVHKDGVYHLGVGGGITCESDLEFEYEETYQKARALIDALR